MKDIYLKDLKENGYICLENIIPKILIKENLIKISEIGGHLVKNFRLNKMKDVKAANKKNFFKIIGRNNYLYKFALLNNLNKLAKKIGCKSPIIGPSYCRVDIPLEKEHKFDWHQDYPNLLGSLNMFTYWIPLTNVSSYTGSIEVLEKSHKLEIFKCYPKDKKNKYNSSNMVIPNKIISNLNLKSKIMKLNIGDLLILHPLLVHRSHYNPNSQTVRYTNIIRLDDASDKKHLLRGFKRFDLDLKNINYFQNYK